MQRNVLTSFFTFALLALTTLRADAATVQNPQGEVYIRALGAAADDWKPVTPGQTLNNGDTLKTKSGSCTLAYEEQASFAVEANTTLTVQDQADSQDLVLEAGKLRAKVNKAKVVKPFQVVTPTAVAAVRGTEVDFDFDENGALTVDLHDDGPVQVYNDDADLSLDLANQKKLIVEFDRKNGKLKISNDCSSTGPVTFTVQGTEYKVEACNSQEVEVDLETAAGENEVPGTPGNESDEPTPDENPDDDTPPPPSSPTGGGEELPSQET